MKFYFKAKNSDGELREGKIESFSQDDAVTILQDKGLIPISLERVEENSFSSVIRKIEKSWEGIKPQELVVFFRQLATLVEAKVSIVASLKAIEEQTENKFLGTVLLEIIEEVEDGLPLSEGMGKHPDVFSPIMINMIRAGEVSGNLQRSITFIADNTEKNYQLTSKIKGALLYPGFVMAAAVTIGFLVFTIILPKLTSIFSEMKVNIPWYTRLIINIGDFMQSYWWAVLTVMVAAIVGIIYYTKTEDGKEELDHYRIKLPIIGKMFRFVYVARFSENLSVLLSGGIPIVEALSITGSIIGNSVYQKIVNLAAEEVKKGGSMASVLAKYDQFPSIVPKMIKIGEESGKTSDVLKSISYFYDQEVDRFTKNMMSLIEPILIVILGIGVAILVFAILMPIYEITNNIS
ncbi:MAG: hypothetical protein ACD_11C00004G0023 [uncultured bacterium]|nr:MAG: hypothetical protein ACD_11C00004G0023 [uncultured bacterium]HBR71656.1 hypothetical protein [Candidatus Moranbacteria bacterium]